MDIKEFMPWVRIIARNINQTLPSNIMLEDLVQDGMIGLIIAFREHCADHGVPFHVFARNKIRWAIMDGLRDGDWAHKSVRGQATKVAKAIEKLQALLHRDPSKKEIADALGVRVDDVTTILGDAYGFSFVRIDEGVQSGTLDNVSQEEAQDIPDSSLEPSAIVERREAKSRAVAGLKLLKPKERKVLILRVMCNMSGQQTATEMGVSESRVSQLYKAATKKLANYV